MCVTFKASKRQSSRDLAPVELRLLQGVLRMSGPLGGNNYSLETPMVKTNKQTSKQTNCITVKKMYMRGLLATYPQLPQTLDIKHCCGKVRIAGKRCIYKLQSLIIYSSNHCKLAIVNSSVVWDSVIR